MNVQDPSPLHSKKTNYLRIGLLFGCLWTAVIGSFLGWGIFQEKKEIVKLARIEAIASFNKDLVYRRWAASHGGLYVPVTEKTPPSPYLSTIPERDITTPSGRKLTLINPAYMTRQVHELAEEQYSVKGHITSLNPIRKQNAPDDWERDALKQFESGADEVMAVGPVAGIRHLRLMRPMVMEERCLKCHAEQGYTVGEIRGGISVSAPLLSYDAVAEKTIYHLIATHAMTAVLGLLGIGVWLVILKRRSEQRFQAEHALFMSEKRHRTLFDESIDGIALVAAASRKIMDCNKALAELLETTKDKLVGLAEEALHSDTETGGEKGFLIDKALSNQLPLKSTLVTETGLLINVELRCSTVVLDQGPCLFVTYRDITEQMKIESRLHQAQRLEAIGTLAGGIAHDFNNLLSPMMGFAELLLEDSPRKSHVREYAGEIHSAALRARDLVKQILSFSRDSEGELCPVSLSGVVRETAGLFQATLPKTITIRITMEDDTGLVLADKTKIHQVIMNLVTNAYHAMEKAGGLLTIHLKQIVVEEEASELRVLKPGNYACLSVGDTGEGMAPDVLERVFDPYFTTKKADKGTGLGLSVVRGIVVSFGGDVVLYSEQGKGTVAKVYLPLYHGESVREDFKPVSVARGKERILLVDDEDSVVRLMGKMLERLGYETTSCLSSTEAFRQFRENPGEFDLVVTDMTMPDMTGLDLAMLVRRIRTDIPVVICTGFSDQLDEERCAAHGINEYIMKPISRNNLATAVRRALDG